MPIYIKNSKQLLFIHIPKSAGSSIHDVLASQADFVGLQAQNGQNSFACSPQHFDNTQLSSLFDLHKLESFSVVRHPLLRVVSEHQYRNRLRQKKSKKTLSLQQDIRQYFHNYKFNKYIFDNHIRPQFLFVSPFTHLFKFETSILSALNYARKLIGSEHCTIPLKQLKKSFKADIVLDGKMVKEINRFYEADFDFFDYEMFDLALGETLSLAEAKSHIEEQEIQKCRAEPFHLLAKEWRMKTEQHMQRYQTQEKALAVGFSAYQAGLKLLL